MKIRIAMCHVLLSSVVFSCAHDSADIRMLETRADYQATDPESQPVTLNAAVAEDGVTIPVRLPPKVAHVWLHAHETPDHEYFWGAWLSVVVSGEEWGYWSAKSGSKGQVTKETTVSKVGKGSTKK